jgi:hypothetical protein
MDYSNILPASSALLGIIPAMIILYFTLKKYEKYFEDKKMFLSFVAGLITGFFSVIIEGLTRSAGIIAFVILIPILEQLIKTIALNLRLFRGDESAPVYGASLGLAYGSIFIPFSMIIYASRGVTLDTLQTGIIVAGAMGFIFFHGATGIYIGYGAGTGRTWEYFIYAVLLQIPLSIVVLLTMYYNVELLQILLIAYGILIYWFATKRILIRVLPKSKRRKMIKK